jgi:hypothetical protein
MECLGLPTSDLCCGRRWSAANSRTLDPAMVAAASIGCGNSTAAATDEIAAERPEEIGEDRPANRAGHVDDQGNIQTRCRQDECGLC